MRRDRERALRNQPCWAALIVAAGYLLLLPGCAAQGIFPSDPLPSAPAGPPPPFPSFTQPTEQDDEGARLLTTAEREAMEAQLSKLAKDR